jgi:hypothetical protein
MKTVRDFNSMTDRYAFDFGMCSIKNGFAQVDTGQDASYFGTWASPEKLMIVCYLEGDIVIQTAANLQEFAAELNNIKTWNEKNGHSFYGIDPGFNEPLKDSFVKAGLSNLLH